MSDEGEATVARRPHAAHVRVRAGMSKPHNWVQLAKFCAVGGSGYVVNLCVFALFVELLGTHHLVAATAAFAVAVVEQLLVEPALDLRCPRRARRLPGAALLRGEHRRLPRGRYGPRSARERGRHAGAARAGDCHRGVHAAQLRREQDLELRDRGVAGLRAALAAALCALLLGAAPAAAAELRQPASQTEPPRFFERSAEQVIGFAERGEKVVARGAAGRPPAARPPTSRARAAGR